MKIIQHIVLFVILVGLEGRLIYGATYRICNGSNATINVTVGWLSGSDVKTDIVRLPAGKSHDLSALFDIPVEFDVNRTLHSTGNPLFFDAGGILPNHLTRRSDYTITLRKASCPAILKGADIWFAETVRDRQKCSDS